MPVKVAIMLPGAQNAPAACSGQSANTLKRIGAEGLLGQSGFKLVGVENQFSCFSGLDTSMRKVMPARIYPGTADSSQCRAVFSSVSSRS